MKSRGLGQHGLLVIAQDDDPAPGADEGQARFRIRPIPHDIAQADNFIDITIVNVGKHRMKGFQVTVNIRNDCRCHLFPCYFPPFLLLFLRFSVRLSSSS